MSWVLITGGAKGLGKALSCHLAKKGYNIVVHYLRSQKEAEETAFLCRQEGVEAQIFQADLLKGPFELPGLNFYGLINNVGQYLIKSLSETSDEEWLNLWATNVHAPFFLIKKFIPILKANKGRIINIGTAGILTQRTSAYCPSYEMSKSTLWHLTRNFARELSKDEVTVNMISPGIMENSVDRSEKEGLIPMKRICSFEDMAQAVSFLLENGYITGQNLEISGGFAL